MVQSGLGGFSDAGVGFADGVAHGRFRERLAVEAQADFLRGAIEGLAHFQIRIRRGLAVGLGAAVGLPEEIRDEKLVHRAADGGLVRLLRLL